MFSADVDIDALPVVEVHPELLLPGYSPRLAGCSQENVERLAELDRPLPPILVQRSTNQVIDGMHRLLAARRRGRRTIAVRYFDGDADSAFVLAVSSNVADGLPLSLNDRKAAAARIVSSNAEWSNRRIAAVTGLSDKTIASIRAWTDRGSGRPAIELDARRTPAVDSELGIRTLVKDPALRSTDLGRLLLRTLSALPVIERNFDCLVDCVPEHDVELLADLALANASVWQRLAEQVAARGTQSPGWLPVPAEAA